MGSDRDMSSNYNMHFSFEKSSQKFTVFHKRNITSSQVTTHLKNYLGEQNNRRTTEEENGWNTPFIKFLPPHLRTPSPKRMLRAHAQHQWTLGAHQHPPPTDRYEQPLPPKGCWERMRNLSGRWGRISPLPQETGTSTPFPNRPVRATPSPKRMLRAHAQLEWTLGAHQTPFPNRPVRATPSPKRMLRAHAQLEWTLGAHQTPFPNRPVRATPSPYPTSLYKGITDRAHC